MIKVSTFFIILQFSALAVADYESDIKFFAINSEKYGTNPWNAFESRLDTPIEAHRCDKNGNFTFIIHGWLESFTTPWIAPMIENFSKYRGGCIFVVDYSTFSNAANYFELVGNFKGIAAVVLKKFQQIGNFDRQLCFGFSFGSRLCIEIGLRLGNQALKQMELCEPAGPGFDMTVDPKPAAQNVACINTSSDKGTIIYNCHQNFRMGICGIAQIAAGPYPLGSHGLCPYMYILAFEHDFIPNNLHACYSDRMVKAPTADVKMGYNAIFDRSQYRGDIFIATAQYPPYVVIDNKIINARV